MVKMKLVKLVPLVLAFVLLMSLRSSASFTPIDNYLIACGSSKSITFQGRTFVPDTQQSSLVLKKCKFCSC
ncbi:hypothetical protein GBA52_013911 [Prunus armeniaca]|nr:hypothetical protein GBA52_013911 [Prunus armeniaca]